MPIFINIYISLKKHNIDIYLFISSAMEEIYSFLFCFISESIYNTLLFPTRVMNQLRSIKHRQMDIKIFISDKRWVGECCIGGKHNKSANTEPRIRLTQPSATGSTEPLQPFLSPERGMYLITKVTTAWPRADKNMYFLQACQFQNIVKRRG